MRQWLIFGAFFGFLHLASPSYANPTDEVLWNNEAREGTIAPISALIPREGQVDQEELNRTLQDPQSSPALRKRAIAGYCLYVAAQVLDQYYKVEAVKPVLTQMNAYLVADLVTGFIHWLEDTYFDSTTPLIGEAIRHNRLHHEKPGEMLKYTFYESWKDYAIAASIVGIVLSQVFDQEHYPFLFSTLAWTTVANQIHKYTHMPISKTPWIVKLVQGYFFQSREEHRIHHEKTDRYYCVMSDFLNVPLETLRFWRGWEWLIEKGTGIPPRLHERMRQKGAE